MTARHRRRLAQALTAMLQSPNHAAAARQLARSLHRHGARRRWLDFLEQAATIDPPVVLSSP